MIRVLLAEDQAMVRGALAALLSREPDITLVAEVARGDEVLAAAAAVPPDVALLDFEMPGTSGAEAAAELRPRLPELTLTEGTVRNYLSTGMQKLNASTRLEAAVRAEQKGWL